MTLSYSLAYDALLCLQSGGNPFDCREEGDGGAQISASAGGSGAPSLDVNISRVARALGLASPDRNGDGSLSSVMGAIGDRALPRLLLIHRNLGQNGRFDLFGLFFFFGLIH